MRADRPRRPVESAQYWAHNYRQILEAFGMRVSMSRRGNRFNNGPIESVWGRLKTEFVHQRRHASRAEAMGSIREWIEIFYNRQHRHSHLGNLA